MKPRRVNVSRMRRHDARTTPDRYRFTLSDRELAASDSVERDVADRLEHWRRRMAIKHPARPVEVETWRNASDWSATVVASVRP